MNFFNRTAVAVAKLLLKQLRSKRLLSNVLLLDSLDGLQVAGKNAGTGILAFGPAEQQLPARMIEFDTANGSLGLRFLHL